MRVRHITISILLVSVLFSLTSCGSDSCPTVDGGPGSNGGELPRASMEGLIEHFAGSMEARDIEAYSECLTQGYLFEFTPEDAESLGLPPEEPWWEKIPDVNSMSNMFSDPEVTIIQVDLPIVSRGYGDGVYTVRCEPSIKVTVEHAGAGEPTTYWVYVSWLDFKVGPDESESGLLQIAGIREELKGGLAPGSPAATEPVTFGRIKSMFR
jgi:hypothetical protein